MNKSNIVLIGMPGVGKSTFGVVLAKVAAKAFIDTDLLLQNQYEASLQNQLDLFGYQELRRREAEILLDLRARNAVIATGGSAVYSAEAMQHLAKKGTIVYLQASENTLLGRINNMASRGIAKAAEQSFHDVYQERVPLYERYADITLDVNSAANAESEAAALILMLQY